MLRSHEWLSFSLVKELRLVCEGELRANWKRTHLRNGAKIADRTILRYGFTSQTR